MNTLHHFGDSFGITTKSTHFVELIANKLKLNYINYSKNGLSNELILSKILENLNKIQSNDYVFINFSYFNRGSFFDIETNEIISTASIRNAKHFKMTDIVEYYLKHDLDYNKRVFNLINLLFKNLAERNIKVFYIFIDDATYKNELISYGKNLEFTPSFHIFLDENAFHAQADGHYSDNIQPLLCELVFQKMIDSAEI